ncbi:unnamed protein product [Lactuca saligna]|uniref:Uncharacterized protein n=1 Tax=Lactuca saligna TaxID=75948 RepID=A0AA35VQE9_LACSI|nr:unnamed protein product [Lactuca saligna]
MKDKRLTSVIKEFDTFTTTPSESVALASNRYRIIVNNMTTHGIIGTPLEYNLKFINSLIKGWGNMKSCLQSNGSLKNLELYQLFDELQGHESNVAQTLRELSGGPLALNSTSSPSISFSSSLFYKQMTGMMSGENRFSKEGKDGSYLMEKAIEAASD